MHRSAYAETQTQSCRRSHTDANAEMQVRIRIHRSADAEMQSQGHRRKDVDVERHTLRRIRKIVDTHTQTQLRMHIGADAEIQSGVNTQTQSCRRRLIDTNYRSPELQSARIREILLYLYLFYYTNKNSIIRELKF